MELCSIFVATGIISSLILTIVADVSAVCNCWTVDADDEDF